MALAAGERRAVWAGPGSASGAAAQDAAVSFPAGMDRAEGGGGEGEECGRVRGDGGGDALAAGEPGADELVGVGAVGLSARRALVARRVLQAIGRTPPGSWAVV